MRYLKAIRLETQDILAGECTEESGPSLKDVHTAEAEDRGLTSREIASVLNSIPVEERMARTEVLAAVNGEHGTESPETLNAIAETLKYMEMRAVDAREDRARLDRENEVRSLMSKAGAVIMPVSGSPLPGESDEWRALMPSLSEYRAAAQGSVPSAGGYTVPDAMAGRGERSPAPSD